MSVDPFGANVGDRRAAYGKTQEAGCQLIRSAPTSVTHARVRNHQCARVSVDPFGANVGDDIARADAFIARIVSVDPFGANVGDKESAATSHMERGVS